MRMFANILLFTAHVAHCARPEYTALEIKNEELEQTYDEQVTPEENLVKQANDNKERFQKTDVPRYNWLKSDGSRDAHAARKQMFRDHQEFCKKKIDNLGDVATLGQLFVTLPRPSREVKVATYYALSNLQEATQIPSEESPEGEPFSVRIESVKGRTALDILFEQDANKKIGLVSASARTIESLGGGGPTGGRHGLTEAIGMQSTHYLLHSDLAEKIQKWNRRFRSWQTDAEMRPAHYIKDTPTEFYSRAPKAPEPRDPKWPWRRATPYFGRADVVVNPGVLFFRSGSDDFYRSFKNPEQERTSVVFSMASLQMNSGPEGDEKNSLPEYRRESEKPWFLQKSGVSRQPHDDVFWDKADDSQKRAVTEHWDRKWKAMLTAAVATRVEILIIPDIGCGAYAPRHDKGGYATLVANSLGENIKDLGFATGKLEKIYLAGAWDFNENVKRAAQGSQGSQEQGFHQTPSAVEATHQQHEWTQPHHEHDSHQSPSAVGATQQQHEPSDQWTQPHHGHGHDSHQMHPAVGATQHHHHDENEFDDDYDDDDDDWENL